MRTEEAGGVANERQRRLLRKHLAEFKANGAAPLIVEGVQHGTEVAVEDAMVVGQFSRSVSAAGDAIAEGVTYEGSPLTHIKYSSISPASPERLCGRRREDDVAELSTERKAIKSTLGMARERDTLLNGVLSSINLVQESGEFFVRGIPIQHSTQDLTVVH